MARTNQITARAFNFFESVGLSMNQVLDHSSEHLVADLNDKPAKAKRQLVAAGGYVVGTDEWTTTINLPYGEAVIENQGNDAGQVTLVNDELAVSAYLIAGALMSKGYALTWHEVRGWAEGSAKPKEWRHVHSIIVSLLGETVARHYLDQGKLVAAVEYHLGLRKKRTVDGVRLNLTAKQIVRNYGIH